MASKLTCICPLWSTTYCYVPCWRRTLSADEMDRWEAAGDRKKVVVVVLTVFDFPIKLRMLFDFCNGSHKRHHHHKCAQLCHLLHFPEMLQKMLIRQENNVSCFCSFVDAGSCGVLHIAPFAKKMSHVSAQFEDVGSWCPLPVVPFASSSVNILA